MMSGRSTALAAASTVRTGMMENTALLVSDVMYGNIASVWVSLSLLPKAMTFTLSARTVDRKRTKLTGRESRSNSRLGSHRRHLSLHRPESTSRSRLLSRSLSRSTFLLQTDQAGLLSMVAMWSMVNSFQHLIHQGQLSQCRLNLLQGHNLPCLVTP